MALLKNMKQKHNTDFFTPLQSVEGRRTEATIQTSQLCSVSGKNKCETINSNVNMNRLKNN